MHYFYPPRSETIWNRGGLRRHNGVIHECQLALARAIRKNEARTTRNYRVVFYQPLPSPCRPFLVLRKLPTFLLLPPYQFLLLCTYFLLRFCAIPYNPFLPSFSGSRPFFLPIRHWWSVAPPTSWPTLPPLYSFSLSVSLFCNVLHGIPLCNAIADRSQFVSLFFH